MIKYINENKKKGNFMKILIIGGSYFLGRVFTMNACNNHDLTLVNRGHYTMSSYNVKEFHFDRHNQEQWKTIKDNYDVVVDFCAYQKDDIKIVVEALHNQIKNYIYISTVDVYKRNTYQIQDENSPLENRHFAGEMGDYIYQKRLLEEELIEICQHYHIHYCSLRPGNIYGPFNYAPRESLFIQRAVENQPLFHLEDETAHFQTVYVKDFCHAILLVIEKQLYDQSFNIIHSELITYDTINHILKEIYPVNIENHFIQEAIDLQYPLPYPLFKEEEELYSGKKIEAYGFHYTSFQEGLQKTFEAFLPVFQKD